MLKRFEQFLLDLAAAAVAGLCLLITVSVVLRATVNSGIPDTVVLVAELMVAAITLPLAAATLARAHIVIELLAQNLPRRVQDWLVVLGSVIGLLALLPLLYAGWHEVSKTFASGSYYFGQLNLPKWPGRLIFLVGLGFCWLRLLIMVVGDLRTILRGDHIDASGGSTKEMMAEQE
ncbi:TRAP transporter small permease [Loktanella agnita]|uniref:TRAP transporter small permease n=1 Tax=Loktanella agnita TaxID=287097 RepID=UPI0039894D19